MTVYITTLKRILSNPLTWAFIVLFPFIFFLLILGTQSYESSMAEPSDISFKFGLVDSDESVLSKALANQLSMQYNIEEVKEPDIAATLTDQEIVWILHIREGYGESVLKGESPRLDGYSLTLSDISALGSAKAENITKSLMMLGTDNQDVISAWEETSKLNVQVLDDGDNWKGTAYWFGFFGFIAMFTAFFVVNTLTEEKLGGMPDRIGVLPLSARNYLIQGSLAAFTATEITVLLTFAVMGLLLGSFINPLHLFLLLSLYNLFTICMVMAIMSLAKDLGIVSATMAILATIFSMLGGIFWPLELVPEFMRKIAWFSPGYWLTKGIENIREITFEGYVLPMLFLLAFTTVAILLGGWKSVQKMEE
jgi:ABC-2 type transport system permease protein